MQASDRQANQARWRGACGAGSRAKHHPNGRGHAGDTNSQKIEIPRLNQSPGTLAAARRPKKTGPTAQTSVLLGLSAVPFRTTKRSLLHIEAGKKVSTILAQLTSSRPLTQTIAF